MQRFFFSFILLFPFTIFSQKIYTLDQCIDKAISKNATIISSKSSIAIALVNQRFGKLSFLPTLSFNTGYNINYGRRVDPFTNTFGVDAVNSNSYGISSQLMLFNGFRYFKQNKLFDVSLKNTYVTSHQTEEKVKKDVVEKYIALLKIQLKMLQQERIIGEIEQFKRRQTELVVAGKLSVLDTLKTEITQRTHTLNLLGLRKEFRMETIGLNFLMGVPLTEELVLPPINEQQQVNHHLTIDEYLQLQELKNKSESLALEFKLNKVQYFPTLSFNGILGTGYSTNNKDYSQPNPPIIPFFTQIDRNAYQGIGFGLNVPIINRAEWHKTLKIYEIQKNDQLQLIELKELEIEKKKMELILQKSMGEEEIEVRKAILSDKEAILNNTQLLYLEGKLRLDEVEKAATDYYDYQQTIQELEMTLFQLNLIRLE